MLKKNIIASDVMHAASGKPCSHKINKKNLPVSWLRFIINSATHKNPNKKLALCIL